MTEDLFELAINPDQRMPSTTGILTPIIPFDLLLDTDYGIIKVIGEAYRDDSVFDLEICDSYYKDLIIRLVERWDKNPLSILMKKTKDKDLQKRYKELQDDYYNSLMEEEEWNIYRYSMYTAIETAVANFVKAEGINPVIMCKNDLQLKFLESIPELKGVQTFVGTYKDLDPIGYDPIYFKDFEDILQIQHAIKSKNLYIAEYNFNLEKRKRFEEPVPRKDLSILFLDSNRAAIISVYPIDETYYYEG